MIFDLVFLGAFVAVWLGCAYLPWLVLSLSTRGRAGLGRLPLALFGGLVGALAVPLLGLDNATGLWLSFLVAFLSSATALGLARLAFEVQADSEPTPGEGASQLAAASGAARPAGMLPGPGIGRMKDIHGAPTTRGWPGGIAPANRPSSREADRQ